MLVNCRPHQLAVTIDFVASFPPLLWCKLTQHPLHSPRASSSSLAPPFSSHDTRFHGPRISTISAFLVFFLLSFPLVAVTLDTAHTILESPTPPLVPPTSSIATADNSLQNIHPSCDQACHCDGDGRSGGAPCRTISFFHALNRTRPCPTQQQLKRLQ